MSTQQTARSIPPVSWTTTVGDTHLGEFGERAAAFTQERESTSNDGTIDGEPCYDGYSARAEHPVNRLGPLSGETGLSSNTPPSTLGTMTTADPGVSVEELCASVDQLCEQPLSSSMQEDGASGGQEARTSVSMLCASVLALIGPPHAAYPSGAEYQAHHPEPGT